MLVWEKRNTSTFFPCKIELSQQFTMDKYTLKHNFQNKYNPVYVKLVVLFFLLGLTIFLLSSHSFDSYLYSLSTLQTDTSPPIDAQETNHYTLDQVELQDPPSSTELHDSPSSTELDAAELHDSSSSTESDASELHDSHSSAILRDSPSSAEELPDSPSSAEELHDSPSSAEELRDLPSSAEELHDSPSSAELQDSPSLAELHGPPSSAELHDEESETECDLFKGDWVRSKNGAGYTNSTCSFIEGHQNCMKNGRPDTDYLYWRWKPRDCELPTFNPKQFLDLMRHKTWALIGDSISRNHVQSVLCLLAQVEQPKQIYHDEQHKSKTWVFPAHNFTLAVIWSPYLIKAEVFEDNDGVSTADPQLHLDKLDETWTKQYNNFDYVIIAGGKWFLKTAIYHENNTVAGCHYCPGKNLTELGFDYAYRKTLKLVLDFMTSSSHKPVIFLRTLTPDHFENGEWHNGGSCPRKVPFKNGEVNTTDVDSIFHRIELEEYGKATTIASEQGLKLKLFNTTQLSLLRPDGHPGPYRQPYPFAKDKHAKVQNDCLHWCLPGPIDSWNDLIMEILMRMS